MKSSQAERLTAGISRFVAQSPTDMVSIKVLFHQLKYALAERRLDEVTDLRDDPRIEPGIEIDNVHGQHPAALRDHFHGLVSLPHRDPPGPEPRARKVGDLRRITDKEAARSSYGNSQRLTHDVANAQSIDIDH